MGADRPQILPGGDAVMISTWFWRRFVKGGYLLYIAGTGKYPRLRVRLYCRLRRLGL